MSSASYSWRPVFIPSAYSYAYPLISGLVVSRPWNTLGIALSDQNVSPVVVFSFGGGFTRSTPSASAGIVHCCQPRERALFGVPPRIAHLTRLDAVVQDLREALAERAEVLADHGQVVLTGGEGAFRAGKTDVARRERDVRDPRRLRPP